VHKFTETINELFPQSGTRRNTAANSGCPLSRPSATLSLSCGEPNGFPANSQTHRGASPSAAFNGHEFLVVWSQSTRSPGYDDDIFGSRISLDGVVLDTSAIVISRAINAQIRPSVASAGSDFLVIWADTRNTVTTNGNTFGGEIYGARVDSDGRVLDSDGFLISTSAFGAIPSLAFNGRDFSAVWGSFSAVDGPITPIRAARIDRTGTLLLTDLSVNASGAHPAIATGPGNTFLVVSEGLRNGATRLIGNLVSVADALVLQSLSLGEGAATLSWRAESGTTYRVQFKSDLSNTNWSDLDPIVKATNSAGGILDSTIGRDSQRFYRVFHRLSISRGVGQSQPRASFGVPY